MERINSPRPVSDETIEAEIRRKGLAGPRVTPADVEEAIVAEYYFTAADGVDGADLARARAQSPNSDVSFVPLSRDVDPKTTKLLPLTLLTFCVLVLQNGFTVTGESACVTPENFDADIGRKVAREKAKEKIWPLLGYVLKLQVGGV